MKFSGRVSLAAVHFSSTFRSYWKFVAIPSHFMDGETSILSRSSHTIQLVHIIQLLLTGHKERTNIDIMSAEYNHAKQFTDRA